MTAARAALLAALCLLAAPAARAAEVSGVVFDDRNGDGLLRAGEPGLSGRTVFADLDGDGLLANATAGAGVCDAGAGEPCVVSDTAGAWRVAGVPPGAQQVRIVAQPGWLATTATAIEVLLASATASVVDQRFGQFGLGRAAGVVFLDADGDGARGGGEAGLPGWTAYADADLDARLDTGESDGVSDAAGVFAVAGLAPATYAVRLLPRCGFRLTLPPPPGRYALTIAASGQVIDGRDFGVVPPAVLPGDGNGDGVVSAADLSAVLLAIGGELPTAGADTDGDGRITFSDLAATAANTFDCAAFVAPPGEPTPTATPLGATATATASATPVAPTATLTAAPPTATGTGSPAATSTASPTRTATASASSTVPPTPSRTASRTPTASPTATASSAPTASQTPGGAPPADALAGTAVQIANGLGAIPAVITALVGGLEFGDNLVFDPPAELAGVGGPAGACPLGGTATSSCTSAPGTVTRAFTFADCEVPTTSGSVTIDELPPATQAVTLRGAGLCPEFVVPPWAATIDVEALFRAPQGGLLLTATAALTGSINPQIGGSCGATGAALTLDGPVRSLFADGSAVTLTFDGTALVVAVAAFNTQCVPIDYTITLNGPATVAVAPAGAGLLVAGGAAPEPLAVVFDDFVVDQDATGTPTLTTLAGDIGAACAGATLTFATQQPLAQAVGEPCPQAGELRVTAGTRQSRLTYGAGGSVALDADGDGVAEQQLASCQEAPLLCGEAPGPTPTASATRSATPLPTTTRTATVTATPLVTPTVTATGAATATVTRTPSPGTATATATASPTRSLSPTVTATPGAAAQTFCDTLLAPAAIPDAMLAGLDNDIVVPPGTGSIADLNVTLDVGHTFVGDLRVTLTHVNSGRSVVLLDRPGQPATVNGCDLDDVEATFDDASLRPAEARCAAGPPFAAIDGAVSPTTALATFNGDLLPGTWRLNVSDRATQDTGALRGWCLEANSPAPVVTRLTCEDADECLLLIDEPFALRVDYSDPDGDAATWEIRGRRDDGFEFDAGSGTLLNPGGGFLQVNYDPFTCPTSDCPDTIFDYVVTIRDQQGHASVAQRVRLIVTLFEL